MAEQRRQLTSNLSMDPLSELKSHREMLHQQLETLDYSKIIVPVNIGVKYRPPKIGIEFYLQNNETSRGTVEEFNRSLNTRKNSFESILINDIQNFSNKLLVHEIPLDLHFFTKEAQIYGERSYDDNRERAHQSPMKPRNKLSAKEITEKLYASDSQHRAFLNPKIIKKEQVIRMIQRAIDRYSNFYEQRSVSRERSQKKV